MIKGFIHVATIGNWKKILLEQISAIKKSGLHEHSKIDIVKVGREHVDSPFGEVLYGGDLLNYEFPTISRLYEMAKQQDGLSWYIHLKGVSKTPDDFSHYSQVYRDLGAITTLEQLARNERAWRKYMEHFAISRFDLCIESLRTHDICGVQWRDAPMPHFSGNFWWADNRYVRSLEHPLDFRVRNAGYRDVFLTDRALAEFWIGSGSPRVKVLCNNSWNLYHHRIQPHSYGIPLF